MHSVDCDRYIEVCTLCIYDLCDFLIAAKYLYCFSVCTGTGRNRITIEIIGTYRKLCFFIRCRQFCLQPYMNRFCFLRSVGRILIALGFCLLTFIRIIIILLRSIAGSGQSTDLHCQFVSNGIIASDQAVLISCIVPGGPFHHLILFIQFCLSILGNGNIILFFPIYKIGLVRLCCAFCFGSKKCLSRFLCTCRPRIKSCCSIGHAF